MLESERQVLWAFGFAGLGTSCGAREATPSCSDRECTLTMRTSASRPLRPTPHLRHVRPSGRCSRLRCLPLHGLEHHHDRPPLRPPRPRQPPARRLAPRRARPRTGGGRRVDVDASTAKASGNQRFTAAEERLAPARGRSVDVAPRNRRQTRRQKELISRNFSKPSDGLEPSTPSLPWRCSTN